MKQTHEVGCSLELVIATEELSRRRSRSPNTTAESRATLDLVNKLAKSPVEFFQTLVETALDLSRADSAGISLLDETGERFVWPAVAGGLHSYIGGGTPSDFGPCGTVMERNVPILFLHPERHFKYLTPIQPALEEVLLIPFYMDGKMVGTLWAVIHEAGRHFDGEDLRVLRNLSEFAASAYQTLCKADAIKPLLRGN